MDLVGPLARLGPTLGPDLEPAWDALRTRLGLHESDAYFRHPMALPVLDLPLWVARALGSWGQPVAPERVERALESAALGYLAVRLQDDWMDEGTGPDPAQVLFLSQALLVRHLALLGGDPVRWQRSWIRYGDAMLLERRVHQGAPCDETTFLRILGRSGPLVLPAAALLDEAGQACRVPRLERVVEALARAHQRFQDGVDASKDLAHGNWTWTVRRFGGEQGPQALKTRLFLGGGLDQVVSQARADLEEAREGAEDLGLEGALAWIQARQDLMERTQRQAWTRLFESLVVSP